MNDALQSWVEAMLDRRVDPAVREFAQTLGEGAGAQAVLFYGSNLRTGSLEGVLDFYVLLPGEQVERIWPRIGYREHLLPAGTMRAKVATLSMGQFARAARGDSADTTIWARFTQPSALIWARNNEARAHVVAAIREAARTAASLAAVLGPEEGTWQDYWRALFRATYRAEFRVERPGREDAILSAAPEHFRELLPLAWKAADLPFAVIVHDRYRPAMTAGDRQRWSRWWRVRQRLGKPLNIVRLMKAATTFDGAADYAAWKVQRHSGVQLKVTPFRHRHPLLSVPGAAWELWRKRRTLRHHQPK